MILDKLDRYLYEISNKKKLDFEIPCCIDEIVEMYKDSDNEVRQQIMDAVEPDIRKELQDLIDGGIIEAIKAKKTVPSDKSYANKYYRSNKEKVKRNKKELDRSIEGKRRQKMKPIMSKGQKTPTGRKKVSYHT